VRASRGWVPFGFVVLSLGLMGMGGLGGSRDTGLPPHDFHATLTDVDGKKVEATHVTSGGEPSLEGEIGRGRLRVPFDSIAGIRLQAIDDDRDHVRAEAQLREGDPVTLLIRSSTTFYGQLPSGAYQIRARDLKSIDFTR
jgi:hypothetical protein